MQVKKSEGENLPVESEVADAYVHDTNGNQAEKPGEIDSHGSFFGNVQLRL